jgi:ferric-dicitrate binding protein FerR (iron transport regulator)
MTDQESRNRAALEDDEERQQRAQSLQRAFMDRARRAVEHDEQVPRVRSTGQRVVAVIAALVLTGAIVFVFDAFLGSMQKVMRMIDEQAEQEKQQEIERKKKEPMPAYVVPSE